jgi:phage tail-like protein
MMTIRNPLPVSRFQVEWGGTRIGFSEVSGLDIKIDTIEYREGNSPINSSLKMPGPARYSNIVLKRGIIASDNEFYNWLKTIKLSTVERRDITISLLNEEHEPVMVWKVRNAFPVGVSGPTLNALSNEVAIEEIELAHEGLTIQNG